MAVAGSRIDVPDAPSMDRARVTIRLSARFLMLVPALALFIFFFVVPLIILFVSSFYDYIRLSGIIPIFTTKNYVRILGDSYYLSIVARTLRLALLTSVCTLAIGYPVALYLLVASAKRRALIILLVISPLLVSVVVRTFGWLIILGPNGLIDSALSLISTEHSALLHTEAAVVIGLSNVLLPFLVLSISTSLQSIDPAVPLAAASLGANPWRVFTQVILPLSLPGVAAGTLIVFSLASSSFVTPALLGGSEYKVLSSMIYQQALVLQNWPLAAALAVVLMIVVLVSVMVQARVIEHGRYRVVFH